MSGTSRLDKIGDEHSLITLFIRNPPMRFQLVNWVVMSYTWIKWDAALKAQGQTRVVRSWFQPYAAWYALVSSTIVLFMQGYG